MTAATQGDSAEYVAGEIDAQELQRRVRARYGVLSAGHQPNPGAIDRARRILNGETSPDAAVAELLAKYADDAEGVN